MTGTTLARRGALEGALAWLAYWGIESFLLHIVPWLSGPASSYMPPNAAFTALLLPIYAVAGLAIGACAGIVLAALPNRDAVAPDAAAILRLRSAVTLVLIAVIITNLQSKLPNGLVGRHLWLPFVPVGFALLIGLLFPTRATWLSLLANPWTACVTLIVLPVLFAREHPSPSLLKASWLMIPYVAAALLIAAFTVPAARPRRWMVTVLPALGVVMAACLTLHQRPVQLETKLAKMPADKPNVMLIVLDSVRADHLSLYGYERDTTPNLRRLAGESTVYTNAISAGDMSLSSHASMFTGIYPSFHQAHFNSLGDRWGHPLDSRYPTLAGILSAKGFDTVSVASNYLFLGEDYGLGRGFAYRDSGAPPVFLKTSYPFLLRDRIRNLLARFQKPWQSEPMFRRAEDIDRVALDVLDKHRTPDGRFFCFLNYMDAHSPYLPPDRFAVQYPGFDPGIKIGRYADVQHEVLIRKNSMPPHERDHLISQYDGAIAYMDWTLGRLVDQLKQRGLYDNTLLIVTSDHGEAFGDKDMVGHGLSVYQDLVHVPLLIKYPGQRSSARPETFVSLTDLAPTILAVLGYPLPKTFQGRSLGSRAASLHATVVPERDIPVMTETFANPMSYRWKDRFQRSAQALFSGSLKFIQSSKGNEELYDLSTDPREDRNILETQPTETFEARLTQYRKAAEANSRRQSGQVGSSTIEQLKSLGYVQGDQQ